MQKAWQALNREQLRMKMIEVHEKNIEKEQKAGINYVYTDIPDSSNARRSTIDAYMLSESEEGKDMANLPGSQLQLHNISMLNTLSERMNRQKFNISSQVA